VPLPTPKDFYVIPLIAGLGTPEIAILFAVLMLVFGGAKLPDLARNSGRALRIFKSETAGLLDKESNDNEQPREGGDESNPSL